MAENISYCASGIETFQQPVKLASFCEIFDPFGRVSAF